MMDNPPYFYSPDRLPAGFRYPEAYVRFPDGVSLPEKFVWWFADEVQDLAELAWETRHDWGEDGWVCLQQIDPIPFAQNGDWAAFFDGNDHSGDPNVVLIDMGNREYCYTLDNFQAWLDIALKQSGC